MRSILQGPDSKPSVGEFLWDHKGKISLVMLAGVALTLAFISTAERQFQSDALLFVGMGRESMVVGPTATTSKVVATLDSRESEVHAVEELLKSRGLAQRIVDRFRLDAVTNDAGSPRALLARYLSSLDAYNLNPLRVYSARDNAVTEFEQNLKITTAAKTNVVSASYRCDDPKLAQDILLALTSLAREEHVRIHRVRGSHKFFETQTAHLQQQLAAASKKLRDAKNESHIVSIAVEQQALQTQMTRIEADSLSTDAALASTKASIVGLRKSINELPEQLMTAKTVGLPNVAADNMQGELFKLQTSVTELATKLGEAHPLVETAREQVRRLEQTIAKQPEDRTQTTTGINNSRQTLDLELRRQDVLAESLLAKARVLKSQYAGLQARLQKLNAHEVRINELQREADIAATAYRSYSEHLEQARIDDQLEEAKISSLTLLQPPTFSETPVSPKPAPTLMIGVVLAALGGVAVALIAQRRQPRRTHVTTQTPLHSEPKSALPHTPAQSRRKDIPEPAISQ